MKEYNLTKKQEELFRKLEEALNACVEENIFIWSNYGVLSAVNGSVVKQLGPDDSLDEPLDLNQVSEILSPDIRENADDELFIKRHVPNEGRPK